MQSLSNEAQQHFVKAHTSFCLAVFDLLHSIMNEKQRENHDYSRFRYYEYYRRFTQQSHVQRLRKKFVLLFFSANQP